VIDRGTFGDVMSCCCVAATKGCDFSCCRLVARCLCLRC